ncbi:MAG TPA: S8 family peptidase [Methylomirabilota bacterium]|nr:S8 family peptidase [Methylomirabilota bacterium]
MKLHLRIDTFHKSAAYKSKRRRPPAPVPRRPNPVSHGSQLRAALQTAQNAYVILTESWEGNENINSKGIIIELELVPGVEFDTLRLEDAGWVLLNESDRVNSGSPARLQRWFVPDGRLIVLDQIINDYLTKARRVKGAPQPKHRPFIESIERIGLAAARELWTESLPFPETGSMWFELWLRAGTSADERAIILRQFRVLATGEGLQVGKSSIHLPEHTVVCAFGESAMLARNFALLSCIAEIRMVHDYADFFEALRPPEQAEWAEDLIRRTRTSASSSCLTVLDTGINRGHPLLRSLLPEPRNLTVYADWSAADDDNHGTLMAGLCAYGNLTQALASNEQIEVPFLLEGVKIVPPPGARSSDERLAGAYTAQGVALAEASLPTVTRVFCLATTMKGPNDPRPTSWSAELDALAVGMDNGGSTRRLFCLSGGNVECDDWLGYPTANHGHTVENPGQAWNALCIGSCTELDNIRTSGTYTCVASRGAMAPSNSTSLGWDNVWPCKPDVVFEGGNAARDGGSSFPHQLPELMLLSTHADFKGGSFGTMCGTSPAAALAARMAAQIQVRYPALWPESVRALIVHSAAWTEAMRQPVINSNLGKRDRARTLLRTVGYGVPRLSHALECLKNRVTLIAQCTIQPFRLVDEEVLFNEMHVHTLPWAKEQLTANPFEKVRMRVTLSYFIEPNPGNRGYTSNYRYASAGLRFRISSAGQSVQDLEADLSKIAAMQAEAAGIEVIPGSNEAWMLGDQCFKGSVHSDVWEGECATALSMQHIAVHPVTGWWRTRPSQGRAGAQLRYCLVVTLETENPDLDLYTEIAAQIETPISVPAS